ncbi:MAG: nitroreductase family protein [Thiomicrorhabdus chilensis]|uniref:nitroreductase family protein n=1 Tax=Thiomicrorhabdus chilensis TaxID=63656 RepID=UPI00299F1683|nr:nitroreductase family protein [Thiomicrorhabdus chilensis]MDX1348044.1 nitroreductase family protein [Thiomicrorhabdus chilensis]
MQSELSTSDLLMLFQSRRTCYQFADPAESPIDRQALLNCLEAARWAPNHKLTQPWRYWWLGPKYKQKLAHIYADNRAKKKALPQDSCDYDCFYQKAIQKFNRIPEILLVGQVLAQDRVVEKEDYAACASGIQNFQLMAWNQGIGVQWSTGPILQDPRTHDLLQTDPAKIELIGALYVGNRKTDCGSVTNAKRKPLEEILTCLD